ncbi:MAG: adenosylcobinamide-GDP ribazoletransferase [Desulfobulbaceae bacterium]|nr:adenosylcobinamide-GDP ribazoletransferase [Desulfobulbaceae bacterium]
MPDFRFFPALCCALRFLTVLPIPWAKARDGALFTASVFAFPVVGLLIGLIGAVIAWLLYGVVPASVLAWFAVLYLSGISGFLHLDGLADSADGLLSCRDRQKMMAIMKDSRSGSMAVAVLVLVILGKFASIRPLADQETVVLPALILTPFIGRTAIVVTMAILPYARQDTGGIGGLFYSAAAKKSALVGLVLLAILGFLLHGLAFFPVVLLSLLVTFLFARYCREKIGGATGDTLGATCELAELAALFAFSLTFS